MEFFRRISVMNDHEIVFPSAATRTMLGLRFLAGLFHLFIFAPITMFSGGIDGPVNTVSGDAIGLAPVGQIHCIT